MEWFNRRRLLELLGNVPPTEAEARYYAQAEDAAMATQLNQIGLLEFRRGSVHYHDDFHRWSVQQYRLGEGAPIP